MKKINKQDIDLIAAFLREGAAIAYPTDTVYGLGCMADNKKAVNKIFRIKQRKPDKALLMLVSSISMAKRYCRISKAQEKILKKYWPGPFSFILESRDKLPKELGGKTDTIAVRLPKNDFIISIIKKIKVPLVSTSLNISGEKPLADTENIENYFKKHKPDLALDAGKIKGKPSTLIDLRDAENVKTLRK